MRDTWNDVAKYVKKKAKTNLDDKIAKVRKERKARAENGDQAKDNDDEEQESDGSDEDSSEEELSEDEMVEDAVKTKEGDAKRKQRKRKKNPEASDTGVDIQVEKDENEEDDYFDSAPTYDDTASFYTMNLSRYDLLHLISLLALSTNEKHLISGPCSKPLKTCATSTPLPSRSAGKCLTHCFIFRVFLTS